MNKLEAKVKLKELLDQGYLTHSLLLDIFEDDEEIPEYMWDVLVTDPRELKQPIVFVTGSEGMKAWEKATKNAVIAGRDSGKSRTTLKEYKKRNGKTS